MNITKNELKSTKSAIGRSMKRLREEIKAFKKARDKGMPGSVERLDGAYRELSRILKDRL